MKKSLIVLALMVAAGAASAQDNSASASSQAGSASQAGAQSGSSAAIILNQNTPATQTISSTATVNGNSTNTENIKYSGVIEQRASGGYVNTDNTNVHYSGTQTIKNVPGIAMSGPASGPCTGASGGLGVAGPGFGVGLNGAKVDDGCTVRENTRILGQLYQSLASDNPAKMEAQAALLEGMAIIRNMNAKIGGDYAAPQPAPKQAAATQAAPATVVTTTAVPAAPAAGKPAAAQAATPIMMPATNVVTLVEPTKAEPTDPYIRARMGLK